MSGAALVPSANQNKQLLAPARWIRYLERRGIIVEQGTEMSRAMLAHYGAEGLYDLDSRTVFLSQNPTCSAFFEEVFHALQHRSGLPDRMTIQDGSIARDIDRWEFEAKRVLIRQRRKLGIPNSETRATIDQLRLLKLGYY